MNFQKRVGQEIDRPGSRPRLDNQVAPTSKLKPVSWMVAEEIHTQCADLAAQEKKLLNSEELGEIQGKLSMFQKQVMQLENRKFRVEANDSLKEQTCNEILERIRKHKHEIEKHIFSSLGKKVQIL